MRWLMRLLPTRTLKTLIAWLGGEEDPPEPKIGAVFTPEGGKPIDLSKFLAPPGIIKLDDEERLWRDVEWTEKYLKQKAEFETNPIALPDSDRYRNSGVSDRDLLDKDEKALFEDLAPEGEHEVIACPPKVEDLDVNAWVTAELERRTGGLTRHPLDVTAYPEQPTAADLAARERFLPSARALFSHGYSMRYLNELVDRAKRKDPTLTDEQLMGLRARGLI